MPMIGGRAALAQHAARRGDHRLLARPCRSEGADRRPRILGRRRGRRWRWRKVKPLVIDYDDPDYAGDRASASATLDYEDFLAERRSRLRLVDAGRRMGRDLAQLHLRHHRQPEGRRLPPSRRRICSRLGNTVTCGMGKHPVYLWTLPMFHCNGWCFPWTLSVVAGTHVCLRWVRAKAMYDAIADHGVTHLCGAPIVMSTLLNAPAEEQAAASRRPSPSTPPPRRRPKPCSPAWRCRLRRHASLRADRDLRPRRRQRMARRLGRARRGRARRAEGAAGRALRGARRPRRASTRRRCSRCPADGETHRRGDVPRQHRDEGLSQEPEGDRGGLRRRLVPFRRSRRHAPGRLHPAQGPLQGHHHLRRREHLLDRGRGRALQASGRAGRCGGRASPTRNGARRRAPLSS